jgi:flagellar hook-associated protein 2
MSVGTVYNAYPNGRPSGLPVDIVDQLVQAKKQQLLKPVENEINELQGQKDVYTSFNKTLKNLYTTSTKLTDNFGLYTAGSTDSSVAEAAASSTATDGSYTLDVSQRAQANTHLLQAQSTQIGFDNGGALSGVADASDSSLLNDQVTIQLEHNGETHSYTTSSDTTLSSLAQEINNDSNGLRAFVTNIGTSDNPELVLDLQSEINESSISNLQYLDGGGGTNQLFTSGANLDQRAGTGIDSADNAALVADNMEISFSHNGSSFSYTTDSGTSLASLAETITDDDNGVTASVANVGTSDTPQYSLIMKSDATGGGGARITDLNGDPGLTVTDLDGSGRSLFAGGQAQQETQSGHNARFTVDGVGYERQSNEFSDVIQGAVVTLKGEGQTQISVSQDTGAMIENVQALIEAYNNIDTFLDSYASYNSANGQAGPLVGDYTARTADNRIDSILTSPAQGSIESNYQYLSDVGIQFQRDGTLSFNSSELKAALEDDPQAVEELFSGDNGIMTKLSSFLESYTNPRSGTLANRLETIDDQVNDLNDEYSDNQQRLTNYRDRMTEKFTNLETMVMKYQGIGDKLSSFIDTWDTKDE